MTNFVTDRLVITKKILELANPLYSPSDLKNVYKTWWRSKSSGYGLRLSHEGMLFFEATQIEHWDVDISKDRNYFSQFRYHLALNKSLNCPFYVYLSENAKNASYVRLYDSRVFVLITLHGSLKQFLDSFNKNK